MAYSTEVLKTGTGLKRISYLKQAGNGWSEIAKIVSKEFELQVTPNTIKNIYQTYIVRRREILEGDQQLKGELKQAVLDWKDQLTRANSIIWEVINNLRAKKKNRDLLHALDRLHSQLYLQNKILTEMNKNVSVTQFNTIEITQTVMNNLKELEKGGFIKVLRLPEYWKGQKEEIRERSDAEQGWR